MSADIELLKLAAKAAGIPVPPDGPWSGVNVQDGIYQLNMDGSRTESRWNPLADDGDALRLAVKLRLIITFTGAAGPHVSAGKRMGPFSNEVLPDRLFELEQDCAATRRAIVRAAAEIGGRVA